jgi:coproporphyrinogen III oxidase-like Fe-S oxidoreductase
MWSCELHANLVDERTIALMKRAGCYNIQLGIESGNNEILKAIRKNITIEEALSACEIIKKHGIELQAFFIVGFPQETEETLRDTFEAMKKTKCDLLAYSIFTPYPGTETFDLCKEQGLIGPDFNLALYGHQSPANHFSIHIEAVRFRQLVDEIEKMADRKNALSRIRSVFSSSTIRKIQMYGIQQSLRKSIKLLMGR